AELVATEWDRGNADFSPTSWQVSNIHAGTGAGNVIPNSAVVDFNFRFSTESTAESLQSRLEGILRKHGLDFTVEWTLGGKPFRSRHGHLIEVVTQVIHKHTGIRPELSTSGGTSDARFIADICPEVVEFGPLNASIHKLNEHIAL